MKNDKCSIVKPLNTIAEEIENTLLNNNPLNTIAEEIENNMNSPFNNKKSRNKRRKEKRRKTRRT
jgi:hypothetical protein